MNIDIDIDIEIFSQYRIDMVSKSKKWYRSITTVFHYPQRHARTNAV